MKKLFVFSLATMLILSTFLLVAPFSLADTEVPAGSVIKGEGNPTLYYLAEDGKRYVFPNSKTFFSWYDDFEDVIEISLEQLYKYPLGGNVRYKPGTMLVKIQTDPKVYAVGENGQLRWIKTEVVAKRLFGNYWNKLIDDVPDSFFTNYAIGDAIDNEEDYSPEEEEGAVDSISANRKLKAKKKIQNRVRTRIETRCERLENAVNRLQKRAELWGLNLPDLGDDYADECVANAETKVTICHKDETSGNRVTIEIARAGLLAHLRLGATLGACADDGTADDSTDDSDTDDDTSDDTDTEAPEFISVEASATGTEATIAWETNKASTGKVVYATESIASTTDTMEEDYVGDASIAHSVILEGLAASTTYYYYVEAEDEAGNTAMSEEDTFDIE